MVGIKACAFVLLATTTHAFSPAATSLRKPIAPALRTPPLLFSAAKGGQQSSPSPLKRLVQRLKPSNNNGGGRGRLATLVLRLRPFIPVFIIVVVMTIRGMQRTTATTTRPVELTYAAFMKLVETRGSSLTEMRISLTRISFLLDGKAAFTRPNRAPQEFLWFLHRHGVPESARGGHLGRLRPHPAFPCLWLAAVWTMMRRRWAAQPAGRQEGLLVAASPDSLSFEDVAGIDTADKSKR